MPRGTIKSIEGDKLTFTDGTVLTVRKGTPVKLCGTEGKRIADLINGDEVICTTTNGTVTNVVAERPTDSAQRVHEEHEDEMRRRTVSPGFQHQFGETPPATVPESEDGAE